MPEVNLSIFDEDIYRSMRLTFLAHRVVSCPMPVLLISSRSGNLINGIQLCHPLLPPFTPFYHFPFLWSSWRLEVGVNSSIRVWVWSTAPAKSNCNIFGALGMGRWRKDFVQHWFGLSDLDCVPCVPPPPVVLVHLC